MEEEDYYSNGFGSSEDYRYDGYLQNPIPSRLDDYYDFEDEMTLSKDPYTHTYSAERDVDADLYSDYGYQIAAGSSDAKLLEFNHPRYREGQQRDGALQSTQRTNHAQPNPWGASDGYPNDRLRGQQEVKYHTESVKVNETHKPRNLFGIKLRPVSDLPDIYRTIFKFGVFNAVQSTCFDQVMHNDVNIVISAPTGSGKTVLFELGLIRMLEENKKTRNSFKCVYVAPTKALCSERFQDWSQKLEPIGLKCCELTGDTVSFGKNTWTDAKNAAIIVTTCEKWDSLTRNWNDHEHVLGQIALFLVDEVHILNESRGSTLEVVISRMKLRGSSVRFILVSATVPNIQDVARWIGCNTGTVSAEIFQFGEEYRPCQLTKHVVGIPRRNGFNDFQFAKLLDGVLFSNIQQFSIGKPILIFCATRKGVFGTAERLMKDFIDAESKKSKLPWSRPSRIPHTFCDKRLDEFACAGIGVHHAGLLMEDRKATEQLFLNKILRVLIATSTLAVGVNLPAQMVVIKGTHIFQNNATKEYSDLDIMQMLGRAGRPQFDTEGIAVILCESDLVPKYKALAQGTTILESSLHTNLVEHLNSEIGLKTITDIDTAKVWLRSSFLYQRMKSNPKFYSIESAGVAEKSYEENVDEILMNSITQLKESQLIKYSDKGSDRGKLLCTEYGEIMSKMYIRKTTMDLLLSIPNQANLRDILEAICGAEEFQEVKLRVSEKTILNSLRKNPDIRFEIKKAENTIHKVFLLVQAILAGINLHEYKTPESQPHLEAYSVFKHIPRIARAFVDVSIVKKDGAGIKHSLELLRCLSAKAWEDRAIVLRQIEQIGEKSIKILAENGIHSFSSLRKQTPHRIESLLNRRPPFGNDVLSSVGDLPQYTVDIKEVGVQSDGGKNAVQVDLLIECGLTMHKNAEFKKSKKSRSLAFQTTAVLTLTSDMDLIDLRRIPTKALSNTKSFEVTAELKKPSQSVIVIITSETIAGVAVQQVYKPTIPSSEYPVLDTRPMSSVDMDLVGLEEDPDFWNMSLDSSSAVGPTSMETKPMETKRVKSEKGRASPTKQKQITQQGTAKKVAPEGKKYVNCGHFCKDKTQCRHICCREGVLVPKGKASPVPGVKRGTLQRLHPTSSAAGTSKQTGSILENLDNIHKNAQVAQNLSLAEGKRLKLEKPLLPNKRKHRVAIDTTVPFTQLADKEGNGSQGKYNLDSSSDSDELPDTIILPDKITSRKIRSPRMALDQVEPENRQPNKRAKRDHTRENQAHEVRSSQLFLEASESEGSVEIITPVKSKKKSKVFHTPNSEYEIGSSISKSPIATTKSPVSLASAYTHNPKPLPTTVSRQESPSENAGADELTDLDAWLQSGSVEIL